jgi:enamine deaminase RidA (YjgF/YER057c/UK114 family)
VIAAIRPERFPWFDYSRYTFSLGLDLGGAALLSGHSASEYDADGKRIVVKGGLADQTRTAFAKIEAILTAARFSLGDIVRVVEYVTTRGIADYGEAERVRREILGETDPAVNTVCVNGLLRPEALIEIEVVAAKQPTPAATAVDGTVYLSSQLPLDDAGRLVGDGDVVAQTRAVYERAGRALRAADLGWDRVTKTVEYIVPAAMRSYRETGQVRREHLGPVYPSAAGIVMERLARADALIQVDFIASRNPPVAVNPGWERYAKLTYSPAVRAGNVLFLSGQAALDPATERAVAPGDIVAQAEYTYDNILTVLRAAGAGPESLVKTVEYVTREGLQRYRETAGVRSRLLREPYPASTGIVCDRLLRPEFLIEVDPLAIIL